MNGFLMFATEAVKEVAGNGENADWIARWIAIVAATAAVGRLSWDIFKYWHDGLQKLKIELTTSDEPRSLILVATNIGRRPVYVKEARLFYMLGGQELSILMPKRSGFDDIRILLPHGDAEIFRLILHSTDVMQFTLGFQQDPDSIYIKILSESGEIQQIPNKRVQEKVRSLLNEFDPEIP